MTERVEIYVDESGHASQGDVFVLAGLGGTSRQWEGFGNEWNSVLSSTGLTEPFHAVAFDDARKQFRPQLQAADLVAYEVRKRIVGILEGDTTTRWQCEKLSPHLYIGSVTIERKSDVA